MKKIFFTRLVAIAFFCMGTLVIKSESPGKTKSKCIDPKCIKKVSAQCQATTPAKVVSKAPKPVDYRHDNFFIKI